MAAVIESLATETGIAPDMIRNALGAIFGFLERHLDPGIIGKIRASLPGGTELPEGAEAGEAKEGGGVFGTLSRVVGKAVGGRVGEGADLVSTLSATGLGLDQIKTFLPKLVALLEAHLPPEMFDQIRSHLHLPGGHHAD
jgi:hypothetical protein